MTYFKLTLVSFLALAAGLGVCASAWAQDTRPKPPDPPAPKLFPPGATNPVDQELPAGPGDESAIRKLPTLLEAEPFAVSPTDDDLVKLLKSRHNAAVKELQIVMMMYRHGNAGLDTAFDAARRVGMSRLELVETAEQKLSVREELFELSKQIEEQARAMHEAAIAPASDYWRARYFRLDAEIQLVRAKRALEKNPAK